MAGGGIEGLYPKKGQKRDFEPPQNGDLGSKCPKFGAFKPINGGRNGIVWDCMGSYGI